MESLNPLKVTAALDVCQHLQTFVAYQDLQNNKNQLFINDLIFQLLCSKQGWGEDLQREVNCEKISPPNTCKPPSAATGVGMGEHHK